MGIVDSPLSTFCQTSEGSIDQIYTPCNINCFLTFCSWKTYDAWNWCSINFAATVVLFIQQRYQYYLPIHPHGCSLTQLWFKMNVTWKCQFKTQCFDSFVQYLIPLFIKNGLIHSLLVLIYVNEAQENRFCTIFRLLF